MKLCANISLLFTERPMLERFSAARDCDFNAVEIQFPYTEDLAELVLRQKDAEIATPLINVPAGDLMSGGCGLASHPKRRDSFKRAVEQAMVYAETLKIEKVNLLAGCTDPASELEHHYDTFLENLNYCADQFNSLGITTVFEAINTEDMPGFLIHSTEQMLQVIKDLNHNNVAMQYDLYHMSKMKQPISEQLPQIIEHIGHIQFADTPDRHQPGSGNMPFEELMTQIKGLNYQHWVGAEYKPSAITEDSLAWMSYFERSD